MRHVPESRLRRLLDEPFAVPDTDLAHVRHCRRCSQRHHWAAEDAARAAALLGGPRVVPDVDAAWARFEAVDPARRPAASSLGSGDGQRRRVASLGPHRRPVLVAASAVAVAGLAAGLTATFAGSPSPGPARGTDPTVAFRQLSDIIGVQGDGTDGVIGGFDTPSGSITLPFGTLRWSSNGAAREVRSVAAAERATGLVVSLPTSLPSGVEGPPVIVVQPRVTATIRFGSQAGAGFSGLSLTLSAGPAVLAEYQGSIRGLPTLGVLAMQLPRGIAAGSSSRSSGGAGPSASEAARLEAYVVSTPGVPTGVVQEVRLLGDLGTVLPVPTPAGAQASQVEVNGSPGVLVSAAGGVVSGVVFEDRGGMLHAALGLLDRSDILHVARQLG